MEGFNFKRNTDEEIPNSEVVEKDIETEKSGFFKKFEDIKDKLKEIGTETKDFLQPGIDNPIATIYEIAEAVVGTGTTALLAPAVVNGIPHLIRGPGQGFVYVATTLSALLAFDGIMSLKQRFFE